MTIFICNDVLNFWYHFYRDEVTKNKNSTKITIADALLPWDECVKSMGAITWISLVIASLFWCLRLVKVLCDCVHYWDIKRFYNTALNICDVSKYLIINKICYRTIDFVPIIICIFLGNWHILYDVPLLAGYLKPVNNMLIFSKYNLKFKNVQEHRKLFLLIVSV